MAANLRLVVDHLYSDVSDAPLHNLRQLPLGHAPGKTTGHTQTSYRALGIVVGAHLALMAAIYTNNSQAVPNISLATPMMVSLVSQPTQIQQAVTPEPPKPLKSAQPAPKKPAPQQEHISSEPVARETSTPQTVNKEANSEQSELSPASPAKTEEPVIAQAAPKEKVAAEPTVEPPRFGAAYLNNPAPEYPPMSRRQGEQGRVLLKVLVSEAGAADHVVLETSSGHEKLDRAAIEAVKKWSFIPAKRNSQAISAYVLVPVKFSLNS